MLRRSMLKTLKAQYMELQNLRELVRAAEEKSDLRFGDRRKERSFTSSMSPTSPVSNQRGLPAGSE